MRPLSANWKMHGADKVGMTRDDFCVDVHAIAHPVQGLETNVGACKQSLIVRLLKRSAHRPIGQEARRNYAYREHRCGSHPGLHF